MHAQHAQAEARFWAEAGRQRALRDLGHIDLLVSEGIYASRDELIRTAIRNQLEKHSDVVRQSVVRHSLDLGLRHLDRKTLEEARAAGERLELKVLGLLTIADDVDVTLATETIASIQVLGAMQAPPEIRKALADRTRGIAHRCPEAAY